jgi:hypothetical protein
VGRAAEAVVAVGAARRARLADLYQELAGGGEFEDLVILLAVAGRPDVAGPVDENAVLALRPKKAAGP